MRAVTAGVVPVFDAVGSAHILHGVWKDQRYGEGEDDCSRRHPGAVPQPSECRSYDRRDDERGKEGEERPDPAREFQKDETGRETIVGHANDGSDSSGSDGRSYTEQARGSRYPASSPEQRGL